LYIVKPPAPAPACPYEFAIIAIDNLFAKNTDKQFITQEDKNGRLFYTVIVIIMIMKKRAAMMYIFLTW
jgi:hypothetical protein